MKKYKMILLSMLAIVLIVCSPFMFGIESCDDKMGEVSNSVSENLQGSFTNSEGNNNPYGLTNEEVESLLQLQKNHRVDQEIVKMRAQKIADVLDSKDQNSSQARASLGGSRTISSTTVAYYNPLKKEDANARVTEDDMGAIPFYTFEFTKDGKNAGIALFTGDERIPNALMVTDEGNLEDISKTNGGLAPFLSQVPAYVERTLKKVNKKRDSILKIAIEKINAKAPKEKQIIADSYEGTDLVTPRSCGPQYRTNNVCCETYTGTSSNYNVNVRSSLEYPQRGTRLATNWGTNTSGTNSCIGGPASSLAVAIAQLTAYHGKLSSAYLPCGKGYSCSWNSIRTESNAGGCSAAHLAYIHTNVSDNGWESWLRNGGYSVPSASSYSLDNFGSIVNSLGSNRPVIMSGYSASSGGQEYCAWEFWLFGWICGEYRTRPSGKRFWITDAFRSYITTYEYDVITFDCGRREISRDRFSGSCITQYSHLNWGFDTGTANGWYNCGVFNASGSPDFVEVPEGDPNDAAAYAGNNFQYEIKQWTNIY